MIEQRLVFGRKLKAEEKAFYKKFFIAVSKINYASTMNRCSKTYKLLGCCENLAMV